MIAFVAIAFTPGVLDTGDVDVDSPGNLFAIEERAVAQQ